MKAVHVALCSLLLSSLASAAARAEEPAPAEAALKASIESDFLKPYVERQRERSRFSRAALPAMEYRVGTVRPTLVRDARGQSFATFTIDRRYVGASKWANGAMTGCVYPQDGAMFLQRSGDDAFRAASFLLGKKSANPPEGVCRPAQVAAK